MTSGCQEWAQERVGRTQKALRELFCMILNDGYMISYFFQNPEGVQHKGWHPVAWSDIFMLAITKVTLWVRMLMMEEAVTCGLRGYV